MGKMRFHNGITAVWLLILSAGVGGQLLDIVNVKTIEDKGTFTITCDASRVQRPQENSNVPNVFGLIIGINPTATTNFTNIAQYHPTAATPEQRQFKAIPTGRDWIINFSGGNGTSNTNTIRIEILVRDAKCTDAGYYSCKMQYLDINGDFKDPITVQNVSAEAATTDLVLSLDPFNTGPNYVGNYSEYNLNTTVTMTCRVDGPQDLVIIWRREIRPAISIDISFEKYPYDNDISSDTPSAAGTGVCSNYHHTSRLQLLVSSADRNRAYQCVIQANGVDLVITGATVDVITPTVAPVASAGSGGSDNIGLIVGVVIGSVVAILIIVVIIILCIRRSKRNKKKDNSDMHDGGDDKYAPPPTMISPTTRTSANSKRDSNVANSKRGSNIASGKTNIALDTSNGTSAKGPPVYAISSKHNPNQEVTWGRPNKGYVDDNRNISFDNRQQEGWQNIDLNKPTARRYSEDDGTDDYGYANFGTNV